MFEKGSFWGLCSTNYNQKLTNVVSKQSSTLWYINLYHYQFCSCFCLKKNVKVEEDIQIIYNIHKDSEI